MPSTNNRSASALKAAFGGDVEVREIGSGIGPAIEFEILDDEFDRWRLVAAWVGEGWPADVSEQLDTLPGPPPRNFVITGRSFSSGALELLSRAGVNWADELGNARIHAPGLFVFREGAEVPRRGPEFSWPPSAIAVAEALLGNREHPGFGTSELATLIDWSPAQVSQVFRTFDANGWTVKYGPQRGPNAKRELNDPGGLLDAWSAALVSREREERIAHRTMRDPAAFLRDDLGPALDESVRWAMGGWAAARELAPIVDALPSLQIYVHRDDFDRPLSRAMESVGLADVAEGGRVSFIPAEPSVLALSQPASTGRVVSAPRAYADLLRIGGRGQDAAAHLREELFDRPLVEDVDPAIPPPGLLNWDDHWRDRLHTLSERRFGENDPYRFGTLSVSYRLVNAQVIEAATQFAHILREVTDHRTGWPVWWAPQVGTDRLRSGEGGALECWFVDIALSEPSHADFWSADPKGQLCLIRPYQEDFEYDFAPGSTLDLVLPVWRVAECVAHAERLGQRLGASEVQLLARWTGLEGRQLKAVERHAAISAISPALVTLDDQALSFSRFRPGELAERGPRLLVELLQPLYRTFGLMEPQLDLVEGEMEQIREWNDAF
jgi:hypothetical protein